MPAPTHTPVDLTDEQRANLAKLAAKHTPGPWKVFRVLSGENKGKLLGIGDAEAAGITDAYGGLWRSGDEMDANADLIAAAPELLAALEPFAWALDELPDETGVGDEVSVCLSSFTDHIITFGDLRKARAAIAKATGYSSALAALNDETNEMVALTNGRHA